MARINQLIQIFWEIDDFYNKLYKYPKYKLPPANVTKGAANCGLSVSEIMTILNPFFLSN